MKTRQTISRSGIVSFKLLFAFALCSLGLGLATVALLPSQPRPASKGEQARGEELREARINPARTPTRPWEVQRVTPNANAGPTSGIIFGHPVISGIAGVGFEQDLQLDPSNPNRLYTSAPGTAAADLSWIWRSLDAGKTFKWVPAAAPFTGKITTAPPCNGGGDTELAVDSAGHLYFNDLTLANFSTYRSDDFGFTFTCSNAGVPDSAVDRQWYAVDGDPTNGGNIYLTNDEIGPGGAMCGSSVGNNVLVMYRSPAGGVGATAGIAFGPANKITAVGSCDEAIMGNNELSPVATTLGQPNALGGGYATLPTPVKHIYVVHDNAALDKILVGRCFPVAFGAPVANVSDPSGLNCTDLLVANLGANQKTGGDFPTLAIDKAGNLYAVWEQATIDASGNVIGDTVLKYSYSTDQGNTWASPIQIDTSGSADGVLHNNVFAWVAAGDDGRVNIAWYGTPGLSNPNDPTCGVTATPPPQGRNINGPDATTGATWSLWLVQTLNGHAALPTFTAPIRASSHHTHRGTIQTLLGGQCGDRTLGDFLQLRTGAQGEAQIGYSDSDNIDEVLAPHGMFVRQNGGPGLFTASSPVSIPGITPFNGASDPTGDATYDAANSSSASMPQLDIVKSSISRVTTSPCSLGSPCYKVAMQLNNLSFQPSTVQDPDTNLVWLTQWFIPSMTDPTGGKNFFAYAESNNGAALQCFDGENAEESTGGGVTMTYPGSVQLPPANCQSVLGPNGTITIYVPLSDVNEASPIDNRLHEVTASTMTLAQPANTVPSFGGVGGSPFNLIDVVQPYLFDPTELKITNITRLTNGHILLDCLGVPSLPNTIEYSPDLITPFTFLGSVVADPTGFFQFEDPDATNLTRRFYRLTLP